MRDWSFPWVKTYYLNKTEKTTVHRQTLESLQNSWSENQVSSITVSGFRGCPLYATAAIEDVKTTRLIEGTFTQELSTLRVPFTAGSINSTWTKTLKF